VALGLVLASLVVPGTLGSAPATLPLLAAMVMVIVLAPLAAAAMRAAVRVAPLFRGRRAVATIAIALTLLFVIGAARRVAEAGDPFRLASLRGLRQARVFLGDVPCDFLGWEHMSWECSHMDPSTFGKAGLAVSEDIAIAGQVRRMFLIPGTASRPRRVEWHGLRATESFVLHWAVPDRHRGGARLTVAIEGEKVAEIAIPREPTERIETERIDTRRFAGRQVTLSLEVTGHGLVTVDGGFVEP
jgi:hypothetical protein